MEAQQVFHIWEGVFENWDDAPEIDGAFNSTKWLDGQVTSVQKEIAHLDRSNEFISPCAVSRDYILPVVVSMAGKKTGKVKVLDFGGGLASSYPLVKGSLPSDIGVEFHVVETEEVCKKGNEVFPREQDLHFHSEMPAGADQFDIVHAARSFQYVDDWRGMLDTFSKLGPKHVILAGALAGDIKPFVTMQNYYGYKIRVRFLNVKELIQEMERLGFRLLYKSLHLSKRLGKESPLPMENFPKERQLEHPCQLLFERS